MQRGIERLVRELPLTCFSICFFHVYLSSFNTPLLFTIDAQFVSDRTGKGRQDITPVMTQGMHSDFSRSEMMFMGLVILES